MDEASGGRAASFRLRPAGHEVVATSLYEDGTPAPSAGLHADVIVADYPPGLPAHATQLARSGPPARSLIGHTRARVRVAAYEGSPTQGV